jgi:hypothetical protein
MMSGLEETRVSLTSSIDYDEILNTTAFHPHEGKLHQSLSFARYYAVEIIIQLNLRTHFSPDQPQSPYQV